MTLEEFQTELAILESTNLISSPERNLRSKVDSLVRNIANLEEKKRRLDYQIKIQKRALARKRMELKTSSKSLREKTQSVLKEAISAGRVPPNETVYLSDDYLLQESARILDHD